VRDELEQAPVGIPEIDARPAIARAEARDRPELDVHAPLAQMRYGVLDPPRPYEAQVAVPGSHRDAGHVVAGVHARPVDVELGPGAAVDPPPRPALDDFRAQHLAVEGVRPLPIRDGDDAVIERDAGHRAPVYERLGPGAVAACQSAGRHSRN